MYWYTKNNHFKFGYQNLGDFSSRQNQDDVFYAKYGHSEIDITSWRKANELAAKTIYENKVGNISVLLSGGMDSEICLISFLQQNLPVKAVTLRYTDIDQSEEIHFIESLKKKYSFQHEYIEVKLFDLILSSEYQETLEKVKCVSPIIGCHLWLANQLSGTPVIAQGEVHLKKNIPVDYNPGVSPYTPSNWYLVESERLCSIYMNFILKNKPAIPGFFQYLPEQTFSFIKYNPYLARLLNNEIPGKLGTRTSKNIISHQFYPDVIYREKLHGWESIQKFHDELRSKLGLQFKDNDASCRLELQDLLGMISPLI